MSNLRDGNDYQGGSPYSSMMNNYSSSIVQMTNPDDELYKMELTFRSQILDRDGYPKTVGTPLMNDLGINSVLGLVQSVVNRVTVMSNFSKMEIPALIDYLADALAEDLMMNRVVYDIKTATARTKIFTSALLTAFVTMKRAYEQGEKIFWKGSQQEVIQTVKNGNERRGLLSSLMGWNKNG